eukprot:364324-Chlamydomonas_euryale.AAC.1
MSMTLLLTDERGTARQAHCAGGEQGRGDKRGFAERGVPRGAPPPHPPSSLATSSACRTA